jgi:MtN3 and saliva related transmembrane protein
MTYLEFSRILTFVGSISITFGAYSQAYKIWRTKSAKDFTPVLIIALVIAELVWLNYGIVLKEWPIITLEALNIPGIFATAILFIKYRK